MGQVVGATGGDTGVRFALQYSQQAKSRDVQPQAEQVTTGEASIEFRSSLRPSILARRASKGRPLWFSEFRDQSTSKFTDFKPGCPCINARISFVIRIFGRCSREGERILHGIVAFSISDFIFSKIWWVPSFEVS